MIRGRNEEISFAIRNNFRGAFEINVKSRVYSVPIEAFVKIEKKK